MPGGIRLAPLGAPLQGLTIVVIVRTPNSSRRCWWIARRRSLRMRPDDARHERCNSLISISRLESLLIVHLEKSLVTPSEIDVVSLAYSRT